MTSSHALKNGDSSCETPKPERSPLSDARNTLDLLDSMFAASGNADTVHLAVLTKARKILQELDWGDWGEG